MEVGSVHSRVTRADSNSRTPVGSVSPGAPGPCPLDRRSRTCVVRLKTSGHRGPGTREVARQSRVDPQVLLRGTPHPTTRKGPSRKE